MSKKRKISGSFLATVGYILSPLSWWNDLFVNFPLAYAFAWVASRVVGAPFWGAFVFGYWLSNLLGLLLMHLGVTQLLSEKSPLTLRTFVHSIVVSLLYTAVIFLLVKWGILPALSAVMASGSY